MKQIVDFRYLASASKDIQ